MLRYFTILVLVPILGCGDKCDADLAFKKKFLNAIEVVKLTQQDGPYDLKYRVHSIEVLSAVTGHVSLVDKDGDTPYFYPSTSELESDIKAWNAWYEENQCNMSLESADSLIKSYDKEFLDYNLDWPPPVEEIRRQ